MWRSAVQKLIQSPRCDEDSDLLAFQSHGRFLPDANNCPDRLTNAGEERVFRAGVQLTAKAKIRARRIVQTMSRAAIRVARMGRMTNYTRSKISESIRQIGTPISSSAEWTASVIGKGPQSMCDQWRASSLR